MNGKFSSVNSKLIEEQDTFEHKCRKVAIKTHCPLFSTY